jgi:hypothetical protein
MELWISLAPIVDREFQRDANLTAFFSKTIPAVVTSHRQKDFKNSCLEVIHRRIVDIRYMIVTPLTLRGSRGVPRAWLQAISGKQSAGTRGCYAPPTPFADCLPLTAYRLLVGIARPAVR